MTLRDAGRPHRHRDCFQLALAALAAAASVGMFGWILWDIARLGAGHLSWDFLSSPPRDSGRSGGIAPILASSAAILAIALAAALPVGVATALLLSETTSRHSRYRSAMRTSLDILAGTPSIVFGLFGNAFFCVYLGLGFSILSGGLTLACMILPLLTRTVEATLRAVPVEWWSGAAALGMRRTATLRRIVLPAIAPAVATGVILGVGRALAETAALLFTSGYVDRMPTSPLDSGRALAVHIYDMSMNVVGGEQAAFASALVLMATLLVLHGCAQWTAGLWARGRLRVS
ncbi:MAG: phosphate ABC transporter permease PstA [Candidatus Binatia bacterium]